MSKKDWRSPEVLISRVKNCDLPLPSFETEGAVGRDIRANLDSDELIIHSLHHQKMKTLDISHCYNASKSDFIKIERKTDDNTEVTYQNEAPVIPTGFQYAIPEGYEIQVRPRSGLSCNLIDIVNSPGTIDQDFRGELGVILTPWRGKKIHIQNGDRIAQIVVNPVCDKFSFKEVSNLDSSARGKDGFGSTGKN